MKDPALLVDRCHYCPHQKPDRRCGSIAELLKLARIEMGSQCTGNVVKPGLPKYGAVEQPLDENHFGIFPDSLPSTYRPPLPPGKNRCGGAAAETMLLAQSAHRNSTLLLLCDQLTPELAPRLSGLCHVASIDDSGAASKWCSPDAYEQL